MSLKDEFKKLAGVVDLNEGERSDLRRKLSNRVGRIEKELDKMAKDQERTDLKATDYDKNKELIIKTIRSMSDDEVKQMLASLKTSPKIGKAIKEEITMLESMQWKNSDVRFAVVLTPTKNSEFDDVYSEVDTMGLKQLILGSPKQELKDIAIFPISDKEEAIKLAKARLQMVAKEANSLNEDIEEHFTKNSKQTESVDVTDWDDWVGKQTPEADRKTRKELLRIFAKTKDPKDAERARKAGATQKELQQALQEERQTNVIHFDVEQGNLEKQTEHDVEKTKVPQEVFDDIYNLIKEIKFKIEHLSHIDPTYQEHGYWFQFMVLMQQIADMLKQGTDEAFKEAATKLQSFENIALVKVPDSLWKFLSIDMYKPEEKTKTTNLSTKFQKVKRRE